MHASVRFTMPRHTLALQGRCKYQTARNELQTIRESPLALL